MPLNLQKAGEIEMAGRCTITFVETDLAAGARELETSARERPGGMSLVIVEDPGNERPLYEHTPKKFPIGCGKETVGARKGGGDTDETCNHPMGEVTPITAFRVGVNALIIRVPVVVEGRELQAVVDSGAEVSVLSSTHYFRHCLPA